MLKLLRDNTLWLAMLIGVIGYRWFTCLMPLVPYMIVTMLFFTFLKVNPLDLRLHRWHWIVLALQMLLSVGAFYLLRPFDLVLAQGVMVCLIMPTATAAAIITGKLGGSIQSLTSFTLLSNIATSIAVPLFFPLAGSEVDMTFLERMLDILRHISPLLIGPFLAAWLTRILAEAYIRRSPRNLDSATSSLPFREGPGVGSGQGVGSTFILPHTWAEVPFYVWAASLVILLAQTTHNLIYGTYDIHIVILLFLGALFTCVLQYYAGKWIGQTFPSLPHGNDYQDVLIKGAVVPQSPAQITRISAGQAFGQKNTTLGIWMAQAYLNPIASLAPAAYIIWQNAMNAFQLTRASHGHRV